MNYYSGYWQCVCSAESSFGCSLTAAEGRTCDTAHSHTLGWSNPLTSSSATRRLTFVLLHSYSYDQMNWNDICCWHSSSLKDKFEWCDQQVNIYSLKYLLEGLRPDFVNAFMLFRNLKIKILVIHFGINMTVGMMNPADFGDDLTHWHHGSTAMG